jgi:hypothetical protein
MNDVSQPYAVQPDQRSRYNEHYPPKALCVYCSLRENIRATLMTARVRFQRRQPKLQKTLVIEVLVLLLQMKLRRAWIDIFNRGR